MADVRQPAAVSERRAPSRGDQQRTLIMDAVTELLATTPISELSVMQIAKHAGLTRPVIYFYFDSKYAIVAAALERVWGEFDAARTTFEKSDLHRPAAEVTHRLIADAVAVWDRHAPLLNACVQARGADPQLAALWEQWLRAQARRVSDLLGVLQAQGRIRPASDDLPAVIEALLGMTLWTLLDERTAAGRLPRERMITAVTDVCVAAVWGAPH